MFTLPSSLSETFSILTFHNSNSCEVIRTCAQSDALTWIDVLYARSCRALHTVGKAVLMNSSSRGLEQSILSFSVCKRKNSTKICFKEAVAPLSVASGFCRRTPYYACTYALAQLSIVLVHSRGHSLLTLLRHIIGRVMAASG